jgi:hypothetical protein
MNNNILNIRAASQIALLGAVTLNLRAVNIIQVGKKILTNFYYEKLENDEEEIPEVFATEMFSYFEDYEITANTIILPLSKAIPEEGIRVFCRKE